MIIISIVCGTFVVGCDEKSDSVVRIHIRANSNSEVDQKIKLVVRDKLVEYIGDSIVNCENSGEVLDTLESRLSNIESIADGILIDSGFEYSSRARVSEEYFPSRDYDGVTFPADIYSALILELGTGKGDNWWCVAYPPLCFVGEDIDGDRVEYRSKLVELISRLFD